MYSILLSNRKRMLNALEAATTWYVSSTVHRKLITPCSWCLRKFTLSTSSSLWRGGLVRELTTNYCSTTANGNNLSFLLLLLFL